MGILGRDGEATLPLEKVPVLFVLELFAEHNHLYEDAADSPDVAPFPIALVRENHLRRPVPSRHHRACHLAGLVRKLVSLIVQQGGYVLLKLVVARLPFFQRAFHHFLKFLFPYCC